MKKLLFMIIMLTSTICSNAQLRTAPKVASCCFANGDFIGTLVVKNVNGRPLTFQILDGNEDGTFAFGNCIEKTCTGCMFIKNLNGILNKDRTVKRKRFNLTVSVNGYKRKVVIIVRSCSGVTILQEPITFW